MSTQFTSHYLLRMLDEPKRILYFTKEEVAAFLLPVIVCYFLRCLFVGIGVGLVCFYLLRNFKDRIGDGHGIVKQVAYKYLPTDKKSGLPDSSIDEYLT